MYKQTLLILGGILLVCAVITGCVVWSNRAVPIVVEEGALVLPVTYTSKETGKWVDIRFYENALVLNGIGFSWLEFAKVPSETEERYENKEENLVLKKEGETVTLVRGRKILFVGTTTEQIGIESPDMISSDTGSTTTVQITEATTSEAVGTTSTETQ